MSADIGGDHFGWLVEGRARNQRSTIELYRLIERHEIVLTKNIDYQLLTQELASVAFLLWQAVFLSDLTGMSGNQLADLQTFLRSLLAHNTVLYQTDYNSREWAFTYYLDNALLRLQQLSNNLPPVLTEDDLPMRAASAKDEWTNAQAALELAISNFAKVIADHDQG